MIVLTLIIISLSVLTILGGAVDDFFGGEAAETPEDLRRRPRQAAICLLCVSMTISMTILTIIISIICLLL